MNFTSKLILLSLCISCAGVDTRKNEVKTDHNAEIGNGINAATAPERCVDQDTVDVISIVVEHIKFTKDVKSFKTKILNLKNSCAEVKIDKDEIYNEIGYEIIVQFSENSCIRSPELLKTNGIRLRPISCISHPRSGESAICDFININWASVGFYFSIVGCLTTLKIAPRPESGGAGTA